MKNKGITLVTYLLILCLGIVAGIFLSENVTISGLMTKPSKEPVVRFDDTRKIGWGESFEVVEIPSGLDKNIQKAYFYRSETDSPRPLIVSLHTWSGSYKQHDEISGLSRSKDFHYIHPDFRGANFTKEACCSELALQDIDDAITFALQHANVDTARIFVIGVSGGGYATLSTFMKSRHRIKKFSAWASVADLTAWYHESRIRKASYADNILACTDSKEGILDQALAQHRSPVHWATPVDKLSYSTLNIYAGIYDGIQGSVPITHSINFYNKVLADCGVTDSSKYVSGKEMLQLLEFRKPLGDFGKIGDRKVCLIKTFKKVKLVIFEGNHEMLTEFAFNELLED